ncbi:toll/interleukin-1 receptor domain-containing protein [Pseudomonas aeruginosa]|uniref:toll/interleukin-1 receptor domain-containing protein n=1 Tax=Pseudomonas aeruginosa TaxID=287 RepID=UPI001F2D78F2|nr:toll/interleukin-1 receptor domain-containing protein [Pseudomonas aeruginosa]MCF1247927.1 toll/interleukin-1 receptor domain-containing protein [Pseudomonas aeruginosa]MDP5593583.1 toll/interleukin-1 receptor domain-containing protein [Pseudomonas aeruginosa]UVN17765.1 TIR domain-containing protein [Pseudomonas aeruginosa]HDQ4566431.1 toll/interleukin-1 receptor domain-containing protein [Pseudomonas aeruginosa]HDQ9033315.1 toll/interleukin-1 receptor domain-containing protein [Pseudomonas
MKIFLSHQQTDSALAFKIQSYLKNNHKIDCYLDVIDPRFNNGEDIAEHVREELGQCTQLLAVVSDATKSSWWVPWEIGVATEKDFPLATFGGNVELPDYLKKWPYLRNASDLDKYAEASKDASKRVVVSGMESASSGTTVFRADATRHFYKTLRAKLGQ